MRFATLVAGALGVMAVASANAEFIPGDPKRGEREFKKCRVCHSLEAGKNKPAGPSLFGVFGRQAGTVDFAFSDSMIEAGEAGLVWTPEAMDAYITDPKAFLEETLGVPRVRNKMIFKLRKESQRADVITYLLSLSE